MGRKQSAKKGERRSPATGAAGMARTAKSPKHGGGVTDSIGPTTGHDDASF